MSFQNVGTVNAGVVKFTGTAPAAGGVPTMDAAGIASGGAFLVSELEKRDPIIRKPLTSVTYPRDIVIQTGGGWVDYVSAMSVAYGLTGGAGSSPVQAGGSNGLPVVQASVDMVLNYIQNGVTEYFDIQINNTDPSTSVGSQIGAYYGCHLTGDIPLSILNDEESMLNYDFNFAYSLLRQRGPELPGHHRRSGAAHAAEHRGHLCVLR